MEHINFSRTTTTTTTATTATTATATATTATTSEKTKIIIKVKRSNTSLEQCMRRFSSYISYARLAQKAYQDAGVKFCLSRELGLGVNDGPLGGIVADEMGLGKTIMMIGLILSNPKPHTLIVLPPALVKQWIKQIEATTGFMPLVFAGQNRKTITNELLQRSPIVITTYGILAYLYMNKTGGRKQAHDETVSLESYVPDRVIFDEAHHLRNSKTKKHQGCINLCKKAKHVWMVTGTPIQNSMRDLYSLMALLGVKSDNEVKRGNEVNEVNEVNNELKRGNEVNEVNEVNNEVKRDNEVKRGNEVKRKDNIYHNLVLRRTKEDVGLQLDPICVNSTQLNWTNECEEEITDVLAIMRQNCCTRELILPLLLKQRQMCVLPKLIAKQNWDDYVQDTLVEIVKKTNQDNENPENPENQDIKAAARNVVTTGIASNSKVACVTETLIQQYNEDPENKALVFCHFRDEIDTIVSGMPRDISVAYIDGRIKANERDAIMAASPSVLVLQIKTCCEGLNLQQYNHVYFVSPHWNPAVEDQAVARAHRFGQERQVRVFRFYMNDTHSRSYKRDIRLMTLDNQAKAKQELKRELMWKFFEKIRHRS